MPEVSRIRRIELLLCSLNDYLSPYADPKTATYSSGQGIGPERKRTCPACQGVGRTSNNSRCGLCWHGSSPADHSCQECETCHGQKRVWWNDYTNQAVEAVDDKQTPKGESKLKAKRYIAPRGFEAVIHRVEAQRTIRDRSGSYKPLERALALLKQQDEVAWAWVNSVYVQQRYGYPLDRFEPPGLEVALCIARGLCFLDERMPGHRPGHIFVPTELLLEDGNNSVNGKGRRARQRVARKRAA